MPAVSICLPVYNGESYLKDAIDSALAQSFDDFELLIGDDCSTDRSNEIAQEYAKKDARIIYWRNEQNKGLFGNYNECMFRASGEYIKPYAQDDMFEPNMLQDMVAKFKEHPEVTLIACARKIVDPNNNLIKVQSEFPEERVMDGEDIVRDGLTTLANGIGEPSTVMFPRKFIGEGFDTSLYHLGDIEYWFRLALHGKFLYMAEVLCSFRRHSASTTNRNARGLRFALDMLKLGDKYKAMLRNWGISEEYFDDLVWEVVSGHTRMLFQQENVTIEDVLEVRGNDEASLIDELNGFKRLALYGILVGARSVEEKGAVVRAWESERNRLEGEISKLLSSRSWKFTTKLRGAVDALRTAKNKVT
ncbi:MAG TPA: glycosyltransferase [Oculatellaceae cyanobacterium]